MNFECSLWLFKFKEKQRQVKYRKLEGCLILEHRSILRDIVASLLINAKYTKVTESNLHNALINDA